MDDSKSVTPIKNIKLPPLKKVTSANTTPLHSPSLIKIQSPVPTLNIKSAVNSPNRLAKVSIFSRPSKFRYK